MIFHRFGTISHILASTELNFFCAKKVSLVNLHSRNSQKRVTNLGGSFAEGRSFHDFAQYARDRHRQTTAKAERYQRRLRKRFRFEPRRRRSTEDDSESGKTASENAHNRHAGCGFQEAFLEDENGKERR